MSAQEVIANPLHAFGLNRNKVMTIEGRLTDFIVTYGADSTGGFHGDYASMVTVRLGDVVMRSRFLKIQWAEAGNPADIRIDWGGEVFGYAEKIEATGDVAIIHTDQTAVGERLTFDLRQGMATLTGDIVLWIGQHIMRGGRLITHLATGASRIDGIRAPLGDRVPVNPAAAVLAGTPP